MFDPQKLNEEQYDALCEYAMDLFSFSATESLSINDPEQYAEVLRLSGTCSQWAYLADAASMELDPEECGTGDPIRVTISCVFQGEENSRSVDVADVYFTLEGMEEKLGTVVWFPERDSWR